MVSQNTKSVEKCLRMYIFGSNTMWHWGYDLKTPFIADPAFYFLTNCSKRSLPQSSVSAIKTHVRLCNGLRLDHVCDTVGRYCAVQDHGNRGMCTHDIIPLYVKLSERSCMQECGESTSALEMSFLRRRSTEGNNSFNPSTFIYLCIYVFIYVSLFLPAKTNNI